MTQLRCPVRDCKRALLPTDGALACDLGHSFDRAKQGYWNLTQPQDKKSSSPGDHEDAVSARRRWIQSGVMNGLVEELGRCLDRFGNGLRVVDLGCGEGTFGALLHRPRSDRFCGIDLSRSAIRMAARNWPDATWVLANADRPLPILDASVDLVHSMFGRRPVEEINRILVPGGHVIVCVPGADDLIELREAVQNKPATRRDRTPEIIDRFDSQRLQLVQSMHWFEQRELSKPQIQDAFAMTYRAARQSRESRLMELESMSVTLNAAIMVFQGNG